MIIIVLAYYIFFLLPPEWNGCVWVKAETKFRQVLFHGLPLIPPRPHTLPGGWGKGVMNCFTFDMHSSPLRHSHLNTTLELLIFSLQFLSILCGGDSGVLARPTLSHARHLDHLVPQYRKVHV